jgi:hypothetical protein
VKTLLYDMRDFNETGGTGTGERRQESEDRRQESGDRRQETGVRREE